MKTDADADVLRTLRAVSRVSPPQPLVCPCGGDVELAGTGHGGAVRCQACGSVHETLAELKKK